MSIWASFRRSRVVAGALFASLAAVLPGIPASGQAISPPALHVMPLPRSVQMGSGELVLGDPFHAVIAGDHDARLDAALDRFLWRLDRECGGIRRAQFNAAPDSAATLTLHVAGPGETVQGVDEDESYKLAVTGASADMTAATDVGAMHGLETFLQLVTVSNGACRLPAVAIDDAPRFPWRGFMLDVSRHFEPVDVIERTLDGMAVAKLNVFHWHLSDDQGFRAESKKFPKFTELASEGLYYTQDQMREVVAYARARGIRVVPEFDMPGHTTSWLLAYPEIGAGEVIKALPQQFGIPPAELDPSNEKTYKFLDEFIGEMATIFPDAYFHIGGDETSGKGWLANPRIAEFMKKKGFTTPAQLQNYFNTRLLPILTKHGKKMMGWDEILNPELPKDIVVQSWRGVDSLSAGAQQGYVGLLSAPYYLDAQKTSEEMFLADPIPADTKLTPDEQKRILGGEVCMWAEQIDPETVDSRVWPRTMAIAERFWSPQSDTDVNDMYRRLRIASLELEDVGLTHITGPEKLRRNIAGTVHPEALDVLASIVEPISFGERYGAQHTDRLTALDRLIDAVGPDPPARQQIEQQVEMALDGKSPADREAGRMELRQRFTVWVQASPHVLALTATTPRLNDEETRARQLGELGATGLEALAFLESHTTASQGWLDDRRKTLADADQASGLVRFVCLPSLQKLVEAAGTR
ncbi:MAG TPA: family 20 glycosylhydrolase [Terracidiphilus sp.]|nr:family 20 glycosylhydrolase [Terracidiphilus sp.]